MNFTESYFEYAGQSSKYYDLLIANVDTERVVLLGGDTKSATVFNKRNHRRHHIGVEYSDSPLQFEMEVISFMPIGYALQREIQKWLFNQVGYKKLYIDKGYDVPNETYEIVDYDEKRFYLNCRFINPEKIEGNGGIMGYRFTVECDSYLAWQDPISKEFSFSDVEETSNQNITISVDTDTTDYIYPKVTIHMASSGGSFNIVNHADNSSRLTSMVDLSANATVVIDGTVNYVSDGYYERFEHRNFVRLLDGDNALSITGAVSSITFEWQNQRYL